MHLPFPIKLHWLIDVDIIGEQHQDLPAWLRQLGYKVTTLSVIRDMPKLVSNSSELAETVYVFHGSFEELNKMKKQGLDVATYGFGPSILRSHYTSYTPENWYLNQEATMTTWGTFWKNEDAFFHHFNNSNLFIRPDSGNKTFTGQVIQKNIFTDYKILLEQTSNVKPETIIWISPEKKIDAEYRFWVANRTIVGTTEYSWTNKPINNQIPFEAIMLVEKVAKFEWQVDRIYVVDVAMCAGQASVIEFNSFSCSGLYNCDSKQLFELVSNDIILEWTE